MYEGGKAVGIVVLFSVFLILLILPSVGGQLQISSGQISLRQDTMTAEWSLVTNDYDGRSYTPACGVFEWCNLPFSIKFNCVLGKFSEGTKPIITKKYENVFGGDASSGLLEEYYEVYMNVTYYDRYPIKWDTKNTSKVIEYANIEKGEMKWNRINPDDFFANYAVCGQTYYMNMRGKKAFVYPNRIDAIPIIENIELPLAWWDDDEFWYNDEFVPSAPLQTEDIEFNETLHNDTSNIVDLWINITINGAQTNFTFLGGDIVMNYYNETTQNYQFNLSNALISTGDHIHGRYAVNFTLNDTSNPFDGIENNLTGYDSSFAERLGTNGSALIYGLTHRQQVVFFDLESKTIINTPPLNSVSQVEGVTANTNFVYVLYENKTVAIYTQ